MRRLPLMLIAVVLAGCGSLPPAAQQTPAPTPAAPAPATPGPASTTPTATDQPPAQATPPPLRNGTRDQLKEYLLSLANAEGEQGLKRYAEERYGGRFPPDEIPWAEADLDADGTKEFVLALPVTEEPASPYDVGAALFVVYRKDGAWAVDRSEPMSQEAELWLMDPHLHAVADLAGLGRPQIVWYRPVMIATGPRPEHVFVTTWKPGQFTNLPGELVISNGELKLDGKDVLLTGLSRSNWMIRTAPRRTDRYRFVDGAFRRIDRRFLQEGEFGHDRLWDGLVAEDSGRTADAERHYRAVLDPAMKAHRGQVARYNMPPRELTEDDLAKFTPALREFAHFRLGALLLQAGRQSDALTVLQGGTTGLPETMRTASSRAQGCRAATTWATANPAFLEALNLGSNGRWTPDLLCTYPDLEDR